MGRDIARLVPHSGGWRRPSNGLLLFTVTTITVGIAMILRPVYVRQFDAFNFLDCMDLSFVGGMIICAGLTQIVSDAGGYLRVRAAASCVVVGGYMALALGVWTAQPALSGIMYTSGAVANFLLATRKI